MTFVRISRAAAAAALTATMTITTVATAQASNVDNSAQDTHIVLGNDTSSVSGRTSIRVNAQAQQMGNWCWAVTGLITSQALGAGDRMSQNDFCKAGLGVNYYYTCPNRTGQMYNVQRGMRAAGVSNTGRAGRTVSFDTIARNIDSGAPIPAGYFWTSGGGHMVAIIGYDSSSQEIMIHDSLRGNRRLVWGRYNDFVSNRSWRWAESITGISNGGGGGWAKAESNESTAADVSIEEAPAVEVKAADTSVKGINEAALKDASASVQGFFAHSAGETRSAAAVGETRVDTGAVELFTLNPDFVRGTSNNPAMADGLATLATNGDEKAVVVFDTSAGSAEYSMTMSGDDEVRYGSMADGGVVFKEPQIGAFYRVKDGVVTGLNDAAKEVVGEGMNVDTYQKVVSAKYSWKMDGSMYQSMGYFG